MDIIPRIAGSESDLFILFINTHLTEKKPIWFMLQHTLSTEGNWGSTASWSTFFPYSWFQQDQHMPFGGAGSRPKLDQGLQHPLNYTLASSESIVVWTVTFRVLASKSERGIVSWIWTLMSICLHRAVPAQTFVESSPCHIQSQRTMDKAWQ